MWVSEPLLAGDPMPACLLFVHLSRMMLTCGLEKLSGHPFM